MTVKYQFKLPDGDWTDGAARFSHVYEHVRDHLRFHRGEHFKIGDGDGAWGPDRTLRQVERPLRKRVDAAKPDDAVFVRAQKDGWTIGVRRHQVADPVAKQMTDWAKLQIGKGYLLGAAGPSLYDCSGLTLANTKIHTGISLFHKAAVQMHDPRVHSIPLSKARPMDMLFMHGNWAYVSHVAYVLDHEGPGGSMRVIDAEPHDTGAPAGWFKGNLGTGVQIRPTLPGYYCELSEVVKVGRIYAVNGKP